MTVEAISPLRRCMIEESNHPVKAARQHVKGCPLPRVIRRWPMAVTLATGPVGGELVNFGVDRGSMVLSCADWPA